MTRHQIEIWLIRFRLIRLRKEFDDPWPKDDNYIDCGPRCFKLPQRIIYVSGMYKRVWQVIFLPRPTFVNELKAQRFGITNEFPKSVESTSGYELPLSPTIFHSWFGLFYNLWVCMCNACYLESGHFWSVYRLSDEPMKFRDKHRKTVSTSLLLLDVRQSIKQYGFYITVRRAHKKHRLIIFSRKD